MATRAISCGSNPRRQERDRSEGRMRQWVPWLSFFIFSQNWLMTGGGIVDHKGLIPRTFQQEENGLQVSPHIILDRHGTEGAQGRTWVSEMGLWWVLEHPQTCDRSWVAPKRTEGNLRRVWGERPRELNWSLWPLYCPTIYYRVWLCLSEGVILLVDKGHGFAQPRGYETCKKNK